MKRFWDKVNKAGPDDCWEWQASLGSKGYGQISIDRKILGAHRVAYTLEHGPISEGLQVAHTCHNKLCCNPAHLEAQTSQENNWANVRDKRTKSVKLSDSTIELIRDLRLKGVSPKEIAQTAGTALWNVENVIYRRRRHLERVSS